ncbi:MAG: SpoIIE family protein phosphatase [Anaerolineae bacterium]|nr:SpoIIE family protein phosphatase [Anaerolineae bacterium]
MHLSVGVAKINKWAVRMGGDTLEMIERPNGGLSLVLADGQSSGPGAKSTSIWVVRKVVSELAEGVRDGAAARAANDALYALRRGKVSSTLIILSVDIESRSVVITRCGDLPTYVLKPGGELYALEGKSPSLGFYRHTRPAVDLLPVEPGLLVCGFTDGLIHAGSRKGKSLDIPAAIAEIWAATYSTQAVADGLLKQAKELDDGRPCDDTSIAVLSIKQGDGTGARTLHAEMPVPDV